MKKIYLYITLVSLFLSGCVNKHGISLKYYSDCKEYYDLQGYYHKECGDDDIITYKGTKEFIQESAKSLSGEEEHKGNVY
jgi:hypothetical protein